MRIVTFVLAVVCLSLSPTVARLVGLPTNPGAAHDTTLGHIAIEVTDFLPVTGPDLPPDYDPFSCGPLMFHRFGISGTATDEDVPGAQGTFGGAFTLGYQYPLGGGNFLLQGQLSFPDDGATWSGYIVGHEDPFGARTPSYSCTVTDTGIQLTVTGSVGFAAARTDLQISSAFPVYVDGAISISRDGTATGHMSLHIKAWEDPAAVVLDPVHAAADPGTNHALTATVRDFDAAGARTPRPVPNVVMRYAVSGSVTTEGQCTTDANGQCTFTYAGPLVAGHDAIAVFADTNGDGINNRGEPSAVAGMTWGDSVPPVLSAPPDVTVSAGVGTCSAAAILGTPTATDDVGVGSITRDPNRDIFPVGTTNVTWTATDTSGNSASAVQIVTVVDGERPSINVPADVFVLAESRAGTTIPASARGTATAADNCAGAVVTVAGIPAADLFPIGRTTVTWTATDAAGNTSVATQHVTVKYGLCPLYDSARAVKLGSTIPVKVQLCSVTGTNLSGADVTIHATDVIQLSDLVVGVLEDTGNANPDFDFRYDQILGAYIFNLSTKGLTTGRWKLAFTVSGDTWAQYGAEFQVR